MSARHTAAVLLAGSIGLVSLPARAATWVSPTTRPSIAQIVAVDKTGEPKWPYGSEDLAGDGATFTQPEQSVDIRTVYAATDTSRFWVRIYVSDPNAVSGNITAFVFIDADQNASTGGSAAATALDPKLTTDPSMGGYEYVIGIRGNGTITQIWTWNETQMMYVGAMPMAAQAAAETGTDTDPIGVFGDAHGYLQASVNLTLVGVTQGCGTNIFVRSVNSGAMGGSDLEAGGVAPCVAPDSNNDGVPDPVVPTQGCTSDDQCPGDGICTGGMCVLAKPCATDTDCPSGERCDAGKCVPKPGGTCDGNADCGDLVCVNGVCNACTQTNDTCGPGRRCGPDGRCAYEDPENASGGIPLDPGDVVQGGACTCGAAGQSASDPILQVLGALVAAAAFLRRKREVPPSDH